MASTRNKVGGLVFDARMDVAGWLMDNREYEDMRADLRQCYGVSEEAMPSDDSFRAYQRSEEYERVVGRAMDRREFDMEAVQINDALDTMEKVARLRKLRTLTRALEDDSLPMETKLQVCDRLQADTREANQGQRLFIAEKRARQLESSYDTDQLIRALNTGNRMLLMLEKMDQWPQVAETMMLAISQVVGSTHRSWTELKDMEYGFWPTAKSGGEAESAATPAEQTVRAAAEDADRRRILADLESDLAERIAAAEWAPSEAPDGVAGAALAVAKSEAGEDLIGVNRGYSDLATVGARSAGDSVPTGADAEKPAGAVTATEPKGAVGHRAGSRKGAAAVSAEAGSGLTELNRGYSDLAAAGARKAGAMGRSGAVSDPEALMEAAWCASLSDAIIQRFLDDDPEVRYVAERLAALPPFEAACQLDKSYPAPSDHALLTRAIAYLRSTAPAQAYAG